MIATPDKEQVPIITLTTDFGLRDPYVGIMKGVIAGIAPHARVIDISHEIEPQNLREAGFVLSTAVPYFPPGSVHVVVVDPGVGSERRAIATEVDGHCFVAPDNGVLSWVFNEDLGSVVELTNREFWLPDVSATFHGRDIFAPVAAQLASGVVVAELGQPVDDPLLFEIPQPQRYDDGSIEGIVQYIDHFGNCVTNIPRSMLAGEGSLDVAVSEEPPLGHVMPTYTTVNPGEPVALVGSHGFLEIAVREGSAAEALGLRVDSIVALSPSEDEP